MYKLYLLLVVFLLGCAGTSAQIKLQFSPGSGAWWLAVKPSNDAATSKIELKDTLDTSFTAMARSIDDPNYPFTYAPSREIIPPLTFRFTSVDGKTVQTTITRLVAGQLLNTGLYYNIAPPPVLESAAPPQSQTIVPTQAPVTQAPVTQAPVTQAPVTKAPVTQAPVTQAPITQAPVTQAPATQAPATQAPATQAPATQAPATQAPVTQAPVTQAPATQAPTTPATVDLCSVVPAVTEPVQIMVPLYVYPGQAWQQLIDAAKTGVKIIAIINPYNGPLAEGPNNDYKNYMKKLNDAGIDMVGYVHTLWGARDINTVKDHINIWATKYSNVKGIFFDEGATAAKDLPYYAELYRIVTSKPGMTHSIINPGVTPDQGYAAISTNLVIYEEDAKLFGAKTFPSWVSCAPNAAAKAEYKYKFTAMMHTAKESDMAWLVNQAQRKGLGVVYVTDGLGGCCTYNTLTTFFANQGSSVSKLNSGYYGATF